MILPIWGTEAKEPLEGSGECSGLEKLFELEILIS